MPGDFDFAFAGSGLDRAGHLRGDPAVQAQLLAHAKVLPLWRGKVATGPEGALVWVDAGHPVLDGAAPLVFLGQNRGTNFFAADVSHWQPEGGPVTTPPLFLDPTEQQHPDLPSGEVFRELRGVMLALDPLSAELAATARAILGWHETHRFCARCGQPTQATQSGWQRSCRACGGQHFPRTDPVVIMLVTRGNSALLGRSPGWPEGMYSCLAGFMEPGETIEAAVRREVAEETGIRIGAVRYLASQPWPFPSSLMIGCHAVASSHEITLDPVELENALWIGREEMVSVLAGAHPTIRPARRGSIAHALIQNWLADRLD